MAFRFLSPGWRSAALGLGLAACASPGGGAAAPSSPPNVVFILADDLGWRDVGFMGSDFYETPNIDRLAAQGMVFTAAYASSPNCAPTRASLMTGWYAPRHGIYTVASAERGRASDRKLIPTPNVEVLPTEAPTLAEALREMGYASASIGKWHLGGPPTHGPEQQGFHLNVGGNRSGHPRSYFSPYDNPQLPDGPAGENLTDRLTTEALSFIDANRDRPFFLYLPYYAVHTPLQAKPELVEKYRRKGGAGGQSNAVYGAMVETMDRGVGRILARLDELGLAENTVVVFTSDNGGHGVITSNEPLRGSKGMLHEGGIRVPLAVRWPGTVRPGSTNAEPVISIDFFPTLLEIAGAPEAARPPLDGVSLVPLLRGEPALERDALYWHFPAYLEAYDRNQGPWRLTPSGAVRSGDFKLIELFEDGRLELYDLRDDPGETRNLADRMPEKAGELHRKMAAWRSALGAPVPDRPNPAYRARSGGSSPPEARASGPP